MTYSEMCLIQEDIIEAYEHGELTEAQLHRELEMLQEQYEDECEDY